MEPASTAAAAEKGGAKKEKQKDEGQLVLSQVEDDYEVFENYLDRRLIAL